MQFSRYYFYINTNILGDFQICISVPLTAIHSVNNPPARTAWKVSKYRVFSGRIFPHLERIRRDTAWKCLNTEIFLVRIFPHSGRIWKCTNTDQKKLRIWTLSTQRKFIKTKLRSLFRTLSNMLDKVFRKETLTAKTQPVIKYSQLINRNTSRRCEIC